MTQEHGLDADIAGMNSTAKIMQFNLLLLICLYLVGIGVLHASINPHRYLASIDESRWTLSDSSATLCRMEHPIPQFGSAIFVREAGRPLRLELFPQRRIEKGINVELRAETSAWTERQTRRVLGRFETLGGRNLFRIPSKIAEQVYLELSEGFQPGFLFYTDRPFIASLSTIRFREQAKRFADCVTALHRDNFRDVRVSNIYFDADEEFASLEEEARAFTRMLSYLAVDDSIREIVVTGHTDNTGKACYNDGLSQRRAWYVYDVLIGLGIEADKLRIDHAGESKPNQRNTSDSSRAANRRVSVELKR